MRVRGKSPAPTWLPTWLPPQCFSRAFQVAKVSLGVKEMLSCLNPSSRSCARSTAANG